MYYKILSETSVAAGEDGSIARITRPFRTKPVNVVQVHQQDPKENGPAEMIISGINALVKDLGIAHLFNLSWALYLSAKQERGGYSRSTLWNITELQAFNRVHPDLLDLLLKHTMLIKPFNQFDTAREVELRSLLGVYPYSLDQNKMDLVLTILKNGLKGKELLAKFFVNSIGSRCQALNILSKHAGNARDLCVQLIEKGVQDVFSRLEHDSMSALYYINDLLPVLNLYSGLPSLANERYQIYDAYRDLLSQEDIVPYLKKLDRTQKQHIMMTFIALSELSVTKEEMPWPQIFNVLGKEIVARISSIPAEESAMLISPLYLENGPRE